MIYINVCSDGGGGGGGGLGGILMKGMFVEMDRGGMGF